MNKPMDTEDLHTIAMMATTIWTNLKQSDSTARCEVAVSTALELFAATQKKMQKRNNASAEF